MQVATSQKNLQEQCNCARASRLCKSLQELPICSRAERAVEHATVCTSVVYCTNPSWPIPSTTRPYSEGLRSSRPVKLFTDRSADRWITEREYIPGPKLPELKSENLKPLPVCAKKVENALSSFTASFKLSSFNVQPEQTADLNRPEPT
jgi:hypothetical protein